MITPVDEDGDFSGDSLIYDSMCFAEFSNGLFLGESNAIFRIVIGNIGDMAQVLEGGDE